MTVFKEDDLVEILRLTYQDKKSSRYIGEQYGVGKSTIGNFLRKETYTEFWEAHEAKPVAGGNIHNVLKVREMLDGRKFVFTSAQSNTFVHPTFFASLLNYCERNNAQLICGRYLYNKNAYQGGKSEEVWFDPKVKPYLLAEGRTIAEDLVYCGELNILPTAVNPLSGLQNYTNGSSAIVPHAKQQLESMPTPLHDPARLMYTTGTCTQRNYVDKKGGQKASHDHIFGALVVEVDGDGDWFVRQVHAESTTGEFYDLTTKYLPNGDVITNVNVEAVNYGDLHAETICPLVEHAMWGGEGNLLDTMKPKYQLLHDSLSHGRRSHHNIKCPLYMFKQFQKKEESVEDEVLLTTKLIEKLDRSFSERIVVDSNHDRGLTRFLLEQDFKTDPVNAIFMLRMLLATYESVGTGNNFHTFEYACRLVNPNMNSVRFLRQDESFKLCGIIEAGSHSDSGNNGGRGSVLSFQKLGTKHNIGHSHQCTIKSGIYQSGMSGSLLQGYVSGGSSWSKSHILTYENGKRTIITQKGSKWRGG